MRQNVVNELPPEGRKLLLALFIPEEIGLVFRNRDVGVHPAAVDANHRLRQEARRVAHVVRNLPSQQLVQLNLVRSRDDLAITVVDFELAGRHFRVVLLILEAHCALHFGRSVNELRSGSSGSTW